MLSEKQQFKLLYNLLLKERPEVADVIVWLQGDRYDRAPITLKLFKEKYAKKILISGNNILIGKGAKMGEKNVSLEMMKKYLLKKGIKEKDILIDDGAMNTKDQAEHISQMAVYKKWSRIIFIGSSYYQPRAFLTFLKQMKKVKWPGKIINQSALIDLNEKPGGRDKSAKIIINDEIEKIKKYKKDLSAVLNGIKYLNKKNV